MEGMLAGSPLQLWWLHLTQAGGKGHGWGGQGCGEQALASRL